MIHRCHPLWMLCMTVFVLSCSNTYCIAKDRIGVRTGILCLQPIIFVSRMWCCKLRILHCSQFDCISHILQCSHCSHLGFRRQMQQFTQILFESSLSTPHYASPSRLSVPTSPHSPFPPRNTKFGSCHSLFFNWVYFAIFGVIGISQISVTNSFGKV